MADLTITAANVLQSTNARVETKYVAGESVTAGQSVYRKASDGRWWKAQNDGTAEEAQFGGIALHAASAGQPLAVQTEGVLTIGGTVAVGTIYAVSATAGGICPVADLSSSAYVSIIGYGQTASLLALAPIITGVEIP